MLTLDELTIGQAKELATLFSRNTSSCDSPWIIGANYFIRTVTHHLTGKLVRVTQQELVLTNAAWIADDGRFADALKKCEFSEVEPFPEGEVIVGRGSLIDAVKIEKLPCSQK